MDKQRIDVLDGQMAYADAGSGTTFVFLHGNPTSSFLWRDVIAEVMSIGRCVAPDLIGMGDSSKLDGSEYRFVDHRRYLDAFLDRVVGDGERLIIVGHDWGSALGFDWAHRHADRVLGLVYMEAIVRPLTWTDWPEASRKIFAAMRSDAGEQMVLEKNVFVERILPASMLRDPSDEEMAEYRRPYVEPGESRRPTLTWPREIPIDGAPADVQEIVAGYAAWLAASDLPKLFVNADPGAILTGDQRAFCRTWPNQVEVTVPGLHFIQEDSGAEIGQAIVSWHATL